MKEEKKTKVRHLGSRRIVFVSLVLLIFVSLMVYAHMYVQIHSLQVVTENDALHSFPFGPSTGTYAFSSTGCRWRIIWKADESCRSVNYGYICIFKVEENKSLFTLRTDLVVVRLQPTSNNTGWFFANLDDVLYETNRTIARIEYYFGEIGTYEIDFKLVVHVYEETLLGSFLREEISIPMETIIYYGP